jgi:glycosyltransferase involved in cell wall biosynthesis|tara:strand:+ start:813 stop:1841 length:1029 start_codon:yes stop_codon:yes gene_type:complete
MKNNSRIAIIIPVFNAERYLYRCLESILSQSYKCFEVLIIDDGSTDSSKEIYQKFVNFDNRFKSFHQTNQGPSSARNLGIEKSNSEYIVFVDSDDFVDINYLVNFLRKDDFSNSDLVCCGYYELSKLSSNPIAINDFKENKECGITINEIVPIIFTGTAGVLWAKLFKSDIIKSNNLKLQPDIKMSEDLIFVLEYVFHTKGIYIINKNGYYYNRLNERSISSTQNLSYLKYIELTNNAIYSIIKKYNFHFVDINDILRQRIWFFIKWITYNVANTEEFYLDKNRKIKSILKYNDFRTQLFFIKEVQLQFKIHLFFLKQNLIILDILYCNILKKMIAIKRYLK